MSLAVARATIGDIMKAYILTAALLFVAACGAKAPEPIKISTSPVERPELVLPEADPLKLRDVKWIVITGENYETVFKELADSGENIVLIGLTDQGYQNLSLNLNDLRTYIQQQNAIILAYRNYYIRSQSALDGAVKLDQ
jgi:hypothetical protein